MGARVAITARRAPELAAAQSALRAEGHEVSTWAADVSLPDTVQPLVDAVTESLGPIDILVNNAGTSWGAPAEEYPLEAWRKVMDLNLTGTWELTRRVATTCMIPRRHGRIINSRARPAGSRQSPTVPARGAW